MGTISVSETGGLIRGLVVSIIWAFRFCTYIDLETGSYTIQFDTNLKGPS